MLHKHSFSSLNNAETNKGLGIRLRLREDRLILKMNYILKMIVRYKNLRHLVKLSRLTFQIQRKLINFYPNSYLFTFLYLFTNSDFDFYLAKRPKV